MSVCYGKAHFALRKEFPVRPRRAQGLVKEVANRAGLTKDITPHVLRHTFAATALQKGIGPKSHDLYNECTQITPKTSAEVSTANVPVIEVDPDGEVVTGFIVSDNYWEMYVNGKPVSVDNTPYTPFNSAIVKFKAKRPYTIAFLLVDWGGVMTTSPFVSVAWTILPGSTVLRPALPVRGEVIRQ